MVTIYIAKSRGEQLVGTGPRKPTLAEVCPDCRGSKLIMDSLRRRMPRKRCDPRSHKPRRP